MVKVGSLQTGTYKDAQKNTNEDETSTHPDRERERARDYFDQSSDVQNKSFIKVRRKQ